MVRSASVSQLLLDLLAVRVPAAATWLRQTATEIAALCLAEPVARRTLQLRYSQAVRHAPRQALAPSSADVAALTALRPGLDPSRWSLDQTARAGLLAALPDSDAEALVSTVDQLAGSADLHELIALYQALPQLAHPPRWTARAAEGLRSNMQAVFAAVALDNPYPAEHLDEDAWNQLVLKCLFVNQPLSRIVGLDQRTNPRLSRMLCDYADERRAAKRPIPAELWRCVPQSLHP